jgi:hypothetical protein
LNQVKKEEKEDNDGHGGNENYPAFVIQGRCIESESIVVRCICRWTEKSDEEAKKWRIGLKK